ncbi:MAG: hypothetical protein QXV17_08265 [Candidatus Micrarchaeaceae archaeon]
MVTLKVFVSDINGNGISGINVSGKAWKSVPWGTNYTLPNELTDSSGYAVYDNVEAEEHFNMTANSPNGPNYQSQWTTGTGSGSSGLLGNVQVNITLKKVQSSINGTCPSGYSLVNGQCVENSSVTTASILQNIINFIQKYEWTLLFLAIIIIVFIIAYKMYKGKIKIPKIEGD